MNKILFTVTNDLCYDQRMDRICTVLAKEGFEVTLVGRKKYNSPPLKQKVYTQKRLNCIFSKGKLFYIEFNLRLFFFLLFSKVDIICSIDLDTLLPGFLVARMRSKKLVYDAHEYFTEVIEVVNRPLVKKIWTTIESLIIPRIRYAYTVSEGLKNLFELKYGTTFEVIRNVPVLEPYEEVEKKIKTIVYIGAVNEGRGLEEMIEVIPYLNADLLVYGEGDLYSRLVQEVKEKGLSERIKFFGYLEPEKLKEETRKAYIGVLLLRNQSLSYYYSLANKFFDYIHAGIPQVVIDFPEYRIINESYKVAHLTTLDRNEIIEGFTKLLNDEEYYQQLKKNCVKAKEVLNWQKESVKLIEFYTRVSKEDYIQRSK